MVLHFLVLQIQRTGLMTKELTVKQTAPSVANSNFQEMARIKDHDGPLYVYLQSRRLIPPTLWRCWLGDKKGICHDVVVIAWSTWTVASLLAMADCLSPQIGKRSAVVLTDLFNGRLNWCFQDLLGGRTCHCQCDNSVLWAGISDGSRTMWCDRTSRFDVCGCGPWSEARKS